MHTDFIQSFFPAAKKLDFQKCYYFFVALFTLITATTMIFTEPGPLILLGGVIGFIGTVSFSFGILLVNYRVLPALIPPKFIPRSSAFWLLFLTGLVYLILALLYLGTFFYPPR